MNYKLKVGMWVVGGLMTVAASVAGNKAVDYVQDYIKTADTDKRLLLGEIKNNHNLKQSEFDTFQNRLRADEVTSEKFLDSLNLYKKGLRPFNIIPALRIFIKVLMTEKECIGTSILTN